jgi:putative NADPH-quinone reductase
MPRRILVVDAHPDPSPERLARALAQAYARGARAAGHEVEILRLADLDIPFLVSQQAFEHDGVPPSLAAAAEALLATEHSVFVFPLWLGGMPALLKAFLEQVVRPGVAFRYRDRGLPEKLLAGRSARIVVTMGMPAFLYRWWYGAYGVRSLESGILGFAGIRPVRTTYLGGVGDRTRAEAWIARVEALGRQAA